MLLLLLNFIIKRATFIYRKQFDDLIIINWHVFNATFTDNSFISLRIYDF